MSARAYGSICNTRQRSLDYLADTGINIEIDRHDRIDKRGGEVIIPVNSKFTIRSEFNTNCENLWVQLNLAGAKLEKVP